MDKTVEILGIDAGGTMTDTIIIDAEGNMVIGKAATTPHDEAIGFLESTKDALQNWHLEIEDAFPYMKNAIYSGTAMLNTLIERKGENVGLLVTKGMEDYLLMERGCQSYLGYHYADRLHSVTHVSNTPLVPKKFIRGIGGRIDLFGNEVIPLYDHEVRESVSSLLDEGVSSICICFVNSYVTAAHENEAKKIALEIMENKGKHLPIYTSSEVQPVWREASRLNCAVIEAYAADPSRKHLVEIEKQLKEKGFKNQLQIMTAHGGTSSLSTTKAFRSLISGPIGGIIGSRYVGENLGFKNIICTDMGGTSFDVGLITDGHFAINPEPDLARFRLNLPMVAVDSIGAGTGTIIKVDPISRRIDLGPESVGSDPGPVCYGNQELSPSICDCDVITGLINPDYYLGGVVRLEKEKALEVFEKNVAKPLGLDPYEAASGMIDLVESQMRDHLYAMVLGRGFETMDYYLFAYGGAGPMHVANYSKGLNFRGICIPSWAPAFSAYGCACADYMHRYDKSLLLVIPPDADDDTEKEIADRLNDVIEELKMRAMEEMFEKNIKFTPVFRMCYTGQLDSLEVKSSRLKFENSTQVRDIIGKFDELYEKVFASAAKFTEAGYQVTEVVLLASVESTKPKLIEHPLSESKPPGEAYKGERQIYWGNEWRKFRTWEMDRILPGNIIEGPAIVEHPATTFVVPTDCLARLDNYRIFWLEQ